MPYCILRISTGELYSYVHCNTQWEIYNSKLYSYKPYKYKTRREAQDVINILAQLQDTVRVVEPMTKVDFVKYPRVKEEFEIVECEV